MSAQLNSLRYAPSAVLNVNGMIIKWCLTVAIIIGAAPVSTFAQVSGRVLNEQNHPLAGVRVEVWSSAGLHVVVWSRPDGTFSSDRSPPRGSQITFRALGYADRTILYEGPDRIEVQLTVRPIQLDAVSVSAPAAVKPCPNKEDPTAREIWEKARSRYHNDTGERAFAARMLTRQRTVIDGTELGYPDESGLRRTGLVQPGKAIDSWIEQNGYAQRLTMQDLTGEYAEWTYPKLHSTVAHHFATKIFAQLHSLSIYSRDSDRAVLAFCGTASANRLEGVITISADLDFVDAQWQYRTAKPHESAGGRVVFQPRPTLSWEQPHLLARFGSFWRRLTGRQSYYESSVWVLESVIGVDPSMESLPSLPPTDWLIRN